MARVEHADRFMASLDLPEVYRVGGSVRDELMHRKAKDCDYVVRGVDLFDLMGIVGSAALEGRCKNYSLIKLRDGRKAGVRAHVPGAGLIEIMLPRTDESTGPGHRDFNIVVDPTITLPRDAERRDFTINAIYKRIPNDQFFMEDPTGRGLYDLQHKLICTTHRDSFRDDPLRTLRALRFVSTLGFDLAQDAEVQMRVHAQAVTGLTDKGVSGTALDELCKLLMGADVAKALRLARDTGVLAVLLPELKPMLGHESGSRYHDLTTDEHTFKTLETAAHVDAPLRVRMALLFHDAGKPATEWVDDKGHSHYYAPSIEQWNAHHERLYRTRDTFTLRKRPVDHEDEGARLWRVASGRLNAPRSLRKDVETLVLNHMVSVTGKIKEARVRRQRVAFGDELLRDLFLMRTCDLSGKGAKIALDQIQHVATQEAVRQTAQDSGVPASVKDLTVDGHDAKCLGLQGRAIGEALRTVLDEVVCQPTAQNMTREWQISRLVALV